MREIYLWLKLGKVQLEIQRYNLQGLGCFLINDIQL